MKFIYVIILFFAAIPVNAMNLKKKVTNVQKVASYDDPLQIADYLKRLSKNYFSSSSLLKSNRMSFYNKGIHYLESKELEKARNVLKKASLPLIIYTSSWNSTNYTWDLSRKKIQLIPALYGYLSILSLQKSQKDLDEASHIAINFIEENKQDVYPLNTLIISTLIHIGIRLRHKPSQDYLATHSYLYKQTKDAKRSYEKSIVKNIVHKVRKEISSNNNDSVKPIEIVLSLSLSNKEKTNSFIQKANKEKNHEKRKRHKRRKRKNKKKKRK